MLNVSSTDEGVVATTRPMSNSSTTSKSQRWISSGNMSYIFTRELNKEP